MLDTVLRLLCIDSTAYNLDDNVVFVILALFLLYCLGYVFNFFQRLLDRATSRKR